jgi:hypothetical protein
LNQIRDEVVGIEIIPSRFGDGKINYVFIEACVEGKITKMIKNMKF